MPLAFYRRLKRRKRQRGLRVDHRFKPELSVSVILEWADQFHRRNGRWPNAESGRISGSDLTWMAVEGALKRGYRGLPGGSSIARLLADQRGYRNPQALTRLAVPQILKWADAYHRRAGHWPRMVSGPISSTQGENWRSVDHALRRGIRELPGGSSLAKLLAEHRGRRNGAALPPLTTSRVLAWADSHRRRTGSWPRETSGLIQEAPGETWHNVDRVLRAGYRGFPGGSSLARLLESHRGVRNIKALPRLTLGQITRWANAYRRRTGEWPRMGSGLVPGTRESWSAINAALINGRRGLPGGSSLAKLLAHKPKAH
jgi:hypothetical protein